MFGFGDFGDFGDHERETKEAKRKARYRMVLYGNIGNVQQFQQEVEDYFHDFYQKHYHQQTKLKELRSMSDSKRITGQQYVNIARKQNLHLAAHIDAVIAQLVAKVRYGSFTLHDLDRVLDKIPAEVENEIGTIDEEVTLDLLEAHEHEENRQREIAAGHGDPGRRIPNVES